LLGYNVETINVYHHHLLFRQSHQIALWDCGGETSVRSLWPYHYPNTSLLLWLINANDRSRLDMSIRLLSQVMSTSFLSTIPLLIVLHHSTANSNSTVTSCINELEVAFRFLTVLPNARSNTFPWQVIDLRSNDIEHDDFKKLIQAIKYLMKL
jgi:GTPase SAR1 family protein